jgi:large subunit ribosomal protein L24
MATPRVKLKIKKGDTVQVIAGKDKGAKGKVILVSKETQRVLVEGVNRIKKHTRVSTTQRGAKTGGIVTQEAPIHISNVMLVVDGKGTRVGSRTEEVTREDGKVESKRVRVARRTGEDI